MFNRFIMVSTVILFVLAFSSPQAISAAGSGEKTSNAPSSVENFTLKDYKGKEHSLADFKDSKAIVLMFVSTRCPVSNAYNERMTALYEEYQDRGVAVIGINSNATEDAQEVKKHAMEHKLPFPILKDVNNNVADKLAASVTPEAYVLNPDFKILYHGRIDDSQRTEEVKSKDLSKAIDEILAGKAVSDNRTKAFGCSIKRAQT